MLMENQDCQNSVLQQLVKQKQEVMALTLTQPTMQVFNGNPINYCNFVRAFEHLFEVMTTSPSAKLYYLAQNSSGHVQELMKCSLSMNPTEGYNEATRLLKERHGQNFQIASAHVNRLIDGPVIKPEDNVEHQKFFIYLTSCINTLNKIGCIGKLDNSENLGKIIISLPSAVRYKWRDTVDRIDEQEGNDIKIDDVDKFVTSRARAANHQLFGKVDKEKKEKVDPVQKRSRPFGIRANGFAAHSKEENHEEAARQRKCPYCKQNYWLSRCENGEKTKVGKRREVVLKLSTSWALCSILHKTKLLQNSQSYRKALNHPSSEKQLEEQRRNRNQED